MQFSTILTSFALATACVFSTGNAAGVPTRETAKVDETILEMSDAFKKGDRRRLTLLLPQVRGHALEPWGAYWEIRARLEEASAQDIQSFLYRYSGTYQEDRLRNDWLLLLPPFCCCRRPFSEPLSCCLLPLAALFLSCVMLTSSRCLPGLGRLVTSRRGGCSRFRAEVNLRHSDCWQCVSPGASPLRG